MRSTNLQDQLQKLKRLDDDNQALRRQVTVLEQRVGDLARQVATLNRELALRSEHGRPDPTPLHIEVPRPATREDRLREAVLAYNQSLPALPEVRAFIEGNGLGGLARRNGFGRGRTLLVWSGEDPLRCDFWGIRDPQRQGEVLVLPGRKYYMDASALARDDGRVGMDALGPMFEITWGAVFRLMQAATGREAQGEIEIQQPGRVEVPQ